MNTDIRLAVSFRGHRKRKRLRLLLGPGSTDYLLDLWIATAMNHPDGILTGMDETDIALEAGWEGEPQAFVAALLECRLLEKSEHGFALHDWAEHQAYVVHAEDRKTQAKNAAAKRWAARTAPVMPTGCGGHGEGIAASNVSAGSELATGNAHAKSGNAPSPSPIPSPSPVPNPAPDPSLLPSPAPAVGIDKREEADREFFWRLGPEETRRFFEESKAFLTDFVGKENVISARVHMDEKTPHMHFLHVPIVNGRLNAKGIYTRDSLKMLQTEFHRHLHSKGFAIQRGVEQEPGAKKKHLDTREFKQQQEALSSLQAESVELVRDALAFVGKMGALREQEAALQERLQSYETQAQEAEKILQDEEDIPEASVFNFKSALEKARQVIALQNKALATKRVHADKAQKLEAEVATLQAKCKRLETEAHQRQQRSAEHAKSLRESLATMQGQLAEVRQFLEQPQVATLHSHFRKEQQAEQERRVREAEEQRQAQVRASREAQRQAEQRATAPSHAPQPSAFRRMRP